MELNEIKKENNRWEQIANALNRNFEIISSSIEGVKESTSRNKGYFGTEDELVSLYPTSTVGDKAYVGQSFPYHVYVYTDSGWADQGKQSAGDERVELGEYYTKTEADQTFVSYDLEADEIERVEKTLVTNALRKTKQTLTVQEKLQSRTNIGAVSMDDVNKEFEAVMIGKATSNPSSILD